MNGGKDIKLGDDKRPVSIVPQNEQNLYNIANGEILTDEFGNPLITEVDTFYLPDATQKKSTSITLGDKTSSYTRKAYRTLGIGTAEYGDFDAYVGPNYVGITTVLQRSGNKVNCPQTVLRNGGVSVSLDEWPTHLEVRTVFDQGERNRLYFSTDLDIEGTLKFAPGDSVKGAFIPDGTFISRISYNGRVILSDEYNLTAPVGYRGAIKVEREDTIVNKHDPTLRIEEAFKDASEVSSTLLGVQRAEVQLSLFSNVSSYGLDDDEFELFTYTGGNSFSTWDSRFNSQYAIKRFNASTAEETVESAIKIESFPVPYSYPFGPNFDRLGWYDVDLFGRYLKFIELGNNLHEHFKSNGSYSNEWKNKFLPIANTTVTAGDADYAAGITTSFAQIDTWTDAWRDIKDSQLIDPVTGARFDFAAIGQLSTTFQNPDGSNKYDSTNTRPGYSSQRIRYSYMQSRRVFRYQPGRISGFTFGLRSSTEPVTGSKMEWGISNPTDQYVFKIEGGQLSIVRRSTIPLDSSALERSGLTVIDQVRKAGPDPFDTDPNTGTARQYWTIDVPRDKFNGDPLNGNGPSGYLIQPNKVTMWKIEFGWYGAIGCRFYAYIPVENDKARWVVVHTFIIENSLSQPCLQDSYFRFKYEMNVDDSGDIRQPQFIYKYGASYYIDGGDEGTQQIYSASSGQKTIFGGAAPKETLLGIRSKDFLLSSSGKNVKNKKLIIPTQLNVSTDSLTELQVETCKGCPGFGHVYTPGIARTDTSRSVEIDFSTATTIVSHSDAGNPANDSYFYKTDEGAKIVGPSIYNAYIGQVSDPVGTAGSFTKATVIGYPGSGTGITKSSRDVTSGPVLDRVTNSTTTIGIGVSYPHQVKLSQRDCYFASDYGFSGSIIEVQFANPINGDAYSHFSDFSIGLTDVEPVVPPAGDELDGFSIVGVTTSVLPDDKILQGLYSHAYAALDENGVENTEVWGATQPPARMAMDFRIPSLTNPAGGLCSKITYEVQNPQSITNCTVVTPEPDGRPGTGHYIQIQGVLPDIEWNGGQVTVLDSSGQPDPTNKTFVGTVKTFTLSGTTFSYIEISANLVPPGGARTNFTTLIRPVKMSTLGNPVKTKLYNYSPWPLYLVGKISDSVAINNLSIRETIGDFSRTVAPKLYVSRRSNTNVTWLGSGEITTAGNNAANDANPPTHFTEVERLSGSEVDTQNVQTLRPTISRDTLYVGANSTLQIDMGKVFGTDRVVIAPDRNNADATFITAKKIDAGSSGTIEVSLNYKEQ